jgi:hypothetical protein
MESAVSGSGLWVRRVQPCWILQGADRNHHALGGLRHTVPAGTVFSQAPQREGVRLPYHAPCGGGQTPDRSLVLREVWGPGHPPDVADSSDAHLDEVSESGHATPKRMANQ